ncbi:MAG: hypothetical protein AB8G15_15350 [Saprospiraceae bacterium]
MEKENNISIHHFFTDPIFVTPQPESFLEDAVGNNKKKVLVICQDPKQQTELLDFLKKILAAIHLDIDHDISLLKAKKGNLYSFVGARRNITFDKMLVFGLRAADLGLNIKDQPYKIINIENCKLLFSDELATITRDKKLKGALWSSLQLLFKKETV